MKIMIMTDMEGVAGLLNHGDWARPEGRFYAKAGTPYSHITHTQSFRYLDMSINGISIGEYGQLALCACELKVPTILACGERALVLEAEQLTPGVITVAVKRGLLPDGLDDLDAEEYGRAKLSAEHLAPKRARTLIREGARKAVETLKSNPRSFRYPDIKPPYVLVCRLRRQGDSPPYVFRNEHPDSIAALMNGPPSESRAPADAEKKPR